MEKIKNRNHPEGLPYLFFSEMWERFGYYLMIGIFTLYMMDTHKGGLEMSKAQAYDIFGTFIALVFLTPFIGGLIADRILGYRLAITIGGLMMAAGYICLSIKGETAFYLAMFLVILGNGFFKPNISTLLGNLYSKEPYIKNKDSGYNIFYMGINLGALICNFVAAYLRNEYSWGTAFMAAGIGMIIGVVIFLAGSRHYKEADVIKPVKPGDMSLIKIFSIILLPALSFGILGYFLPVQLLGHPLMGTPSTDAFFFGALPVVLFYISLWVRADKEEKRPIAALLVIFGVSVIFWAVFKQNGTALTTWAENYTDRQIPETVEPLTRALHMDQHITLQKDSFPLYDANFRTQNDSSKKVIKVLSYHPYLQNLDKDSWPAEGEDLKLISTELFQSVNPFFVVVLTPLVVAFFAWLRRRRKEPSTPAKVGWGLLITACSPLLMIGAVWAGSNGLDKSSAWWLIGCYGVITVGELFLSPIGLSLVSKLSPPRITALMMGGWFLSTSLGNKLSGVLAGLWDSYEHKQYFFMVNMLVAFLAAVIVFIMLRWLRTVVEEHAGKS
jgi:POT family proton-dependent oligopeptide transporter